MESYIIKPGVIKKYSLLKKDYIFSPSRHHDIKINSKNDFLVNLIEVSKQNINLKNKNNYFNYVEIGSIDNTTGYVEPTHKKSIHISTNSVSKLQKEDILISTVRTYLGGIGIIKQDDNNLVATKALIVLRKLKKDIDRYYLFGILRSSFFIEQTNLILNASIYPRMDRDSFNRLKIPFPTTINNAKPQDVEKLVSLIMKNILDKEEQIKIKNLQISEIIEKEIKNNQKIENFKFNYPKINEIKKESRFDTGLYEKDFKKNNYLIKNYKYGFFQIPFKNITTGQTPQDYFYPKSKSSNSVSLWITPKNLHNNILQKKLWIHTNKKNTIKDGDIIFGSRGTVGDLFFYDEKKLGKVYINQSTSGIRIDGNLWNKIFVLCYFSSVFFKNIISKYIYDGTVPAITPDILTKFLIPQFSEEKQKEIANIYYNEISKNANLTFSNYLEKETARNSKLGIFQLNMEIFDLNDRLEDIVSSIIKKNVIKISFDYSNK